MPTTLRPRAMPRASCYYAVARLVAGRTPIQPEISAALAEGTGLLGQFLTGLGIPAAAFCERLVNAAGAADSARETARMGLIRAVGAGNAALHFERLAGLSASLEAAYDRAFPTIGDELALRARPLLELWDAYGPGLVAAVGRATEKRLLVDEATLYLVQPFAAGGGGQAYAASNSAALEAVLANPHARLPETVRLAWLVCRLGADLPDFVEMLPAGTAESTMAWGMLPAVLDAAGELEVVRPGDDLLATAAEAWELPVPEGASCGAMAEAVAGWWGAYRARPVPFAVALAALERLMAETGGHAEEIGDEGSAED